MYKVMAGMMAAMVLLVGCGQVDLDGASYQVGHTDARVDGLHSSTGFEIDGLSVTTTHTEYHPETTTEGEFEISEEERARIDALVQAVLEEPDDDYLCTDSPSGRLQVQFADGTTDDRGVTFCGQEEAAPLRDLVDYLGQRYMP